MSLTDRTASRWLPLLALLALLCAACSDTDSGSGETAPCEQRPPPRLTSKRHPRRQPLRINSSPTPRY
jgi:hypothetical protein